ncbi:MAG: cytochrome P450 [Chloroflexi bacterium]|nr:cytochrome P450 [Chloroflexota bacterium]
MTTTHSRPPGPKGNSAALIIQRLFDSLRPNVETNRESFMLTMAEWPKIYGDQVYYHFFPMHMYMFSHPDDIHDILVKQADKFHKSTFYKQILSRFLGNGMLISDGEFWKRQRKLAQPAFHHKRIVSYADTMVRYTERMMAGWQHGQVIDAADAMMKLTLAIVGKTLFDADVDAEAKTVGEAMEVIQHTSTHSANALIALPDWVPTAQNRERRRAVAALDAIVMRMIRERRESGEDKGDLLSMLLLAVDEQDGTGMTDQQARDEALTLFLAGHETTSNALAWTWYLLGEHPEAEARLHAELDRVLAGRAPTMADLKDLPYTEQVIKESMRLYPPAPGFSRQVIEAVEIGGCTVPKGASVFIFSYAVHRDERWFPNPLAFQPERWTPEFEKGLPKYAYFPFGGGPRICIGNSFAMMETQLVLATMAQRFQLKLVPGQEIVPEALITLRPRNGVQVELIERQPAAAPADHSAVMMP